jgi:hypothetical protein
VSLLPDSLWHKPGEGMPWYRYLGSFSPHLGATNIIDEDDLSDDEKQTIREWVLEILFGEEENENEKRIATNH